MSGSASTRRDCVPVPDPPPFHNDKYDATAAEEVINSSHVLHVSFPPDPADPKNPFPVVLNLVGRIGAYQQGTKALYIHGFVPKRVADRIKTSKGSLPVTVTACKANSYYLGFTPFSHGFVFRSVVLNGTVDELDFPSGNITNDEQVDDREIEGNEKLWALHHIVNGLIPEEWEHTRRPLKEAEIGHVHVLRVNICVERSRVHKRQQILGFERQWDIDHASANHAWEGAIPMWETYGQPIPGPHNKMNGTPPHVAGFFEQQERANKKYAEKAAMEEWPYCPL